MKKTEVKPISELILNSRRSDRELAKAVGVSQPTVGRMIKKLEKEGYIREYTIVPDFQRLGYHLMALIFVKLKQGLTAEKIEEARRIAQESLKTGPFEVVMLERGIGWATTAFSSLSTKTMLPTWRLRTGSKGSRFWS